MGSNLMDEIDCANFFYRFDDLIDFPPEDDKLENVGAGGGLMNSGGFPITWNDELPNPDAFLSKNAAADLSSELYVPYEDIVQLEWLSTFVEDSYSDAGLNLGKESSLCPNKGHQFQTTGPVYVLESSSSSSSSNVTNSSSIVEAKPDSIPLCGPQRARSKRPRPATFSPRPPTATLFEESGNVAESNRPPPPKKVPELSGLDQQENKKKKRKKERDRNAAEETGEDASAVRKCMHCEIMKTPQWRAGPMGPKTLCNACGVRYKSGRLFPEYRPAASPTFVPSVHSNSHKKVVEMRNKVGRVSTLKAEESASNENRKNVYV